MTCFQTCFLLTVTEKYMSVCKFAGAIFVCLSCFMYGCNKAIKYKKRTAVLRALYKLLIVFENNIVYYNKTLEEIASDINFDNEMINDFLNRVFLMGDYKNDITKRWNDTLLKYKKIDYLKKEDILFIQKIGQTLSDSDCTNISKLFEGMKNELVLLTDDSVTEEMEKGKLCKVLGVLFGIFISILFL
ncbi:MAG: hypothetical protein E7254_04240 [Lachnospiraceae bacterium]|nr:hypothetical protein [Lachnospiraceae bacterium]